MRRRHFLISLAVLPFAGRLQAETFEITLTEAEWKAKLSPARFAVLREADTEPAFSSPLNDEHRKGTFICAGCALPL